MVSFIVGFIVIIVTFYIALIYSSATIGLFGFAETVLFVMAFLYLLLCRRKISSAIQIPIAVVNPGEKISILVQTENTGKLACMKIRYKIGVGRSFKSKKKKNWYAGDVVYSGKNIQQQQVYLKSVGNYVFTLEKIRIYDMTGIFYMDKRIKKHATVQVFPELVGVSVQISERTRNFYGDSDIYDDFHPGNDCSEIFDVREFRDGDRIQRIHWKLSAKSDDLLVREDSQPLACPLVFILDYQEKDRSARKRQRKNQDCYLSVAASISFSLMDEACPHYVSWYSGNRKDMVRIRVDDEESYYLFLVYYLADSYGNAPMPLEEMYKEKYHGSQAVYTMTLTSDLQLGLNKQVIAEFNNKDWKETIQKLEIVL